MSEPNATIIAVRGLSVRRGGNPVLRGVDADVEGGKVTGLLGPSGSGKTTLMRAIVGVQTVEAGEVTVLGLPAGHPRLRRQLGYVTQAPSVYPDLTVVENLRYFAEVLGCERERVEAVLETVSLQPFARRTVQTLSGGERSRASLAVALLARPAVLVLDEPTVGLDPRLRIDLWAMFHRLAASGVTLLVSTHVMDEATRCDSLLLMRNGEVVASGSEAELLARTGTRDIEQAFLALAEPA